MLPSFPPSPDTLVSINRTTHFAKTKTRQIQPQEDAMPRPETPISTAISQKLERGSLLGPLTPVKLRSARTFKCANFSEAFA